MTEPNPETPEPAERSAPDKARPDRSVLRRLLDIRPAGILRLAILSLLTGLVMSAAQFSLQDPHFNAAHLASSIAETLVSVSAWLIGNLWKPLLAGSLVVIPLWILWRLVTLPFRK